MFNGAGGDRMNSNEFVCARSDCENIATRKTHNQKYCSDECCRVATNRRIMEKYYDRKAQRNGKKRYCFKCSTELSKYNNTQTCSSCTIKSKTSANAFASSMLSNSMIV